MQVDSSNVLSFALEFHRKMGWMGGASLERECAISSLNGKIEGNG